MKVEQFLHANQFHIYSDMQYEQENGEQIDILQSYDSTVVKITRENGKKPKIVLGTDWDYSKTTSTHVFAFLEEYGNITFKTNNKRNEIRKMIQDNKILYDKNM